MVLVFPMVGRSSRFAAAGYTQPKYRLDLHGRPVFDWVLEGFREYFSDSRFVFAHRAEGGVAEFVSDRLSRLGVKEYATAPIEGETSGQAGSVLRALRAVGLPECPEPLLIFNIDSFRPLFRAPSLPSECAGYLEVFEGAGEGWSFVEPDPRRAGRVARTTEKIRISNLCSTGLYTFRSVETFCAYAGRSEAGGHWKTHAAEFYVAPLYNDLIRDSLPVYYHRIEAEDVMFCGVPAEYESLCAGSGEAFRRRFHEQDP